MLIEHSKLYKLVTKIHERYTAAQYIYIQAKQIVQVGYKQMPDSTYVTKLLTTKGKENGS